MKGVLNLFLHQTPHLPVIVARNTEIVISSFNNDIRGDWPTETRSIPVQESTTKMTHCIEPNSNRIHWVGAELEMK
jgi:hypothetical protein